MHTARVARTVRQQCSANYQYRCTVLDLSLSGCRSSSTILELDCRQSIPSQNSLEQPENIANSSLEITGTQSKFCEYRESYGDINEDDQSCFSICSHIQSVIFSDLHSKLHSQCHFQICAKNRVLRYLGERFPGRMCCAFRGSPPELCPISVHVRYGIRMLSVSAFHRCAGRYGTAHWYVRGTETKMTRRKKIEFKDLRTPTTKGYPCIQYLPGIGYTTGFKYRTPIRI